MFSATTGSLWLYPRLVALYASIKRFPVTLTEFLLSLYFSYWNLSPCIVDLDDDCQTSMHVWATNQPRSNKSNLVLVHGYGGNSKWQFVLQVAQLTSHFNVYIPDLVFFGKSLSSSKERSDTFQAKCVCDVMKKVLGGGGEEKYSVYGISYGGFVVYRMAEMEEKSIEKVVIVSSGIVFTEDQKKELLKKIGMNNVVDVLVPEKPQQIKTLCRLSMYKIDVTKWLPDFFLRGFIAEDSCKKEKQELVEYLLMEKPDLHFPVLNQETLILWGDKDNIFPVHLAHDLHRHLGLKSKLEILKDVGHATSMEAPASLNKFVTSFITGGSVIKR